MSELLGKDEIVAIEARANNTPKFNAETYSFDIKRLAAHVRALEAERDEAQGYAAACDEHQVYVAMR